MKPFFSVSSLPVISPSTYLQPRCGQCGLHKTCQTPYMPVSGKGREKILIVGEAPGATEDREGVQFCGESGLELEAAFAKFGLDMRRDCWLHNALSCRPPGNKIPKPEMVDYCRPYVLKAIKELKPHKVLLFGATAVKSVLGHYWKRDLGLNDGQGKKAKEPVTRWLDWHIPLRKPNMWICANIHPDSAYLYSQDKPVVKLMFERYLKRALSFSGRPWQEIPDYESQLRVISDHHEAAREIRKFIQAGKRIAFDFENNMLKPDPPNARIVCCSVSDGVTSIAFDWHGEAIKAMRELVRSPQPKVASNLKHEERWTLKEFGCMVRNWDTDTMLTAHWLDNREAITSVKFQAFVLCGQEPWDDHIKPYLKAESSSVPNRIHELDPYDLKKYCCYDSLMEMLVAQKQRRKAGLPL